MINMLSQVANQYVNKPGAATIVGLIFDRLQQVNIMSKKPIKFGSVRAINVLLSIEELFGAPIPNGVFFYKGQEQRFSQVLVYWSELGCDV